MSECKDSSCSNDKLEDSPYCILHADKERKDKSRLLPALQEYVDSSHSRGAKFRDIIFPLGYPHNAGVKFFEQFGPQISFHRCEFKGHVDFSECEFEEGAHFAFTRFRKGASFHNSTFSGYAAFGSAEFDAQPNFSLATFKNVATFRGATFEYGADFSGVAFQEVADFQKTTSHGEIDFDNSTVEGKLDLAGSELGELTLDDVEAQSDVYIRPSYLTGKFSAERLQVRGNCYIEDVEFKDEADASLEVEGITSIRDVTFEQETNFSGSQFLSPVTIREVEFDSETVLDHSQFQDTVRLQNLATSAPFSLRGCTFEGRGFLSNDPQKERLFENTEVHFSGVQVDASHRLSISNADLRSARFLDSDIRNIRFTGVEWPRQSSILFFPDRDAVYDEQFEIEKQDSEWSKVERLYRGLKQNYEEIGDYYRAGHFHIGEKEAHLRVTNRPLRRLMLYAYRGISLYGERASPAFFWLSLSLVLFAFFYLGSGLAPVEGSPYPLTQISGPGEFWHSFSNAFAYSLQVTVYSRPEGYALTGADGYMLKVVQRAVTTPLIALAALAIRQQMKR